MKLFHNATFYTMEKEGETYCALLEEDGKIIDLFTEKPTLENVEEIDLQGRFVYPGFIDTHTHSFEGGLYSLGANLEFVKTLDDVFAILRKTKPIGGMIFAYHFDENGIEEKRFPTAKELDEIFPDLPVILRRVDGHSCVINTIASQQVAWEVPLPQPFTGLLNRRWNDTAANWFHLNVSEEGIVEAYHQAARLGLKTGHTGIHTMIGNGRKDPEHYELIRHNLPNFPLEFVLYPQITDVPTAVKLGATRIGGCILADGSFGSHTAGLSQPYADQADTSGNLYQSDEFWEKLITEAHANDLQVCVHAIGDAAISQILKYYEAVQKADPKDLRHEMIHNELNSDEMIKRIASAKVSAVMQPMFDRHWAGKAGLYERVLGIERTKQTTRLKSLYEAGVLLTGGSDWYITALDPLQGIDAAVRIHNPEERLTPFQAIDIYTRKAAHLSHDENRFGTLKAGKQADFVVLKDDIFTSKEIAKIAIDKVVKLGFVNQM